MTKSIFKDKFPINSIEINKNKTTYKTANEIASYFEEKINKHPVAKHISTFDNFEHTSNINGAIQDGIKAALVVIFCVGKEIPTPKILAIRPRAFGITELENSFSIDFMDAPSENLIDVMATWTKELINK
jgi:hypothetical protein